MADEPKKIIVDDDWKKQARAEKEKLAAEVAEQEAASQQQMQEPSFDMLVQVLATNAVASLGGMSDPSQGPVQVDPVGAKLFIDLLAILEEKTAGNLEEKEKQALDDTIAQLRNYFVQVMQAIRKQQEQGGGGPAGGGAAPGGPTGDGGGSPIIT